MYLITTYSFFLLINGFEIVKISLFLAPFSSFNINQNFQMIKDFKIFKRFVMIACLFKKYPFQKLSRKEKKKKKTISFLRHLILTYYVLITICLLTKYSFTNSLFSNKPSSPKRNNSLLVRRKK